VLAGRGGTSLLGIPLIDFRDSAAGRQACVQGTSPAAWRVDVIWITLYLRRVIATLEQTRRQWDHLMELARHGEEILITEEGRAVAKLSGLLAPVPLSLSDREEWLKELSDLRCRAATVKSAPLIEELLDEDRAETVP
jgi:antitoxin (DNA-binding transcriptional repressor) of toxin-antitoxin stability system